MTVKHRQTKRSLTAVLKTIVFYAVLIILTVIVSLPFFWMISTSLKNRGALMSIPVEWLPKNPGLDAYQKLFTIPFFLKSIANSFYLAIACTLARLICAAMSAYGLTKIPFRGRGVILAVYISALMIPAQITFIPIFIIMSRAGLANNLNAFILLQLFNAFAIFMLCQHMRTIHDAYTEAALLDGANRWQIFSRIILPFCSGTLATLAILGFMDIWNDYLLPLTLLTDRSKATLTVLLSTLSSQYQSQYNLSMAGALVSIVPILAVYIGAQKFFREGLAVGGVKG
ncbi:MAG: carbohydrate ABC transporter permease [Treponema sp.]|jgi:multiple sugar transport system permease protein|nr:carbohydrate ABC transporter permease [Treponema sp.]